MATTDRAAPPEAKTARPAAGGVVGHRPKADGPPPRTVTTGSGARWSGGAGTSLVVLDGGLAVTSLLRP